MDLHNRFGDDVEKDSGLLGPDGQPLALLLRPLQRSLQRRRPPGESRNWIFSIISPALVFRP